MIGLTWSMLRAAERREKRRRLIERVCLFLLCIGVVVALFSVFVQR